MCSFFFVVAKKIFTFFLFVSLYKALLEILLEPTWETFSACPIVFENLCEVFGCSIVTDFMSTIFQLSLAFSCGVVIFDQFIGYMFFLFK